MLNNKGFVVSTVLYTLLIAFLLFLGVLLSNFSSSIDIISNANSDLVNGNVLRANQFRESYSIEDLSDYDAESKSSLYYTTFYSNNNPFNCIATDSSGVGYKWYQKYQKDNDGKIDVDGKVSGLSPTTSSTLVKINSKYGTLYWPKDFVNTNLNENIEITCSSNVEGVISENCQVIDLSKLKDIISYEMIDGELVEKIVFAKIDMTIEDTLKGDQIKIVIGDVCR